MADVPLDALTGAFSFTGRAIAARLLAEGRSVVTLVRRPDLDTTRSALASARSIFAWMTRLLSWRPWLASGSGIDFEDRGAHELKGVPGEWRRSAVKP